MDFDLDQDGAMILSLIGLIPYFGWGIYALRLHYRYHEDLKPVVAAITLVAVSLFYLLQTILLRVFLQDQPGYFLFALMGLFVSGAALYSNMAVSLLSQLLVDAIVPGDRSKTNEPRYGPGEALERLGDYDGAIDEYLIIARIFPKEPKPLLHVADNYVKLEKPGEAVRWFERALRLIKDPDDALQVVNRACSIYLRNLNQPMDAIRVLEDYLEKFSGSEFVSVVETRIERIEKEMDAPSPVPAELENSELHLVEVEEDEVVIPVLPSQREAASEICYEHDSGLDIPVLPEHPSRPKEKDMSNAKDTKDDGLLPL